MKQDLVVREHDWLVRADTTQLGDKNISILSADAFDALQTLVEAQGSDLNPVAIPGRKDGRPALKLTQWVGLIRLPGGQGLEILPKTHERPGSRAFPGSEERSRAMLIRMLAATDERFRVAPPAELDTARMPLYEVVLRYALEGIKVAVRRGLPHTYVPVHEERPGLRGQLDLARQVRQLPTRAHLLHVVYDEYLPDRPETRLTRLTVERVASATRLHSTKQLARELLMALDGVPPSRNVAQDFRSWRLERGHQHFAPLAPLCRMVLHELNPLVSGTNAQAHALLFDMNKVYEAYVAHHLRQTQPDWQIETQVTDNALGEATGTPAFHVRPDLLITLPTGERIVADTKWKRLHPHESPTYGVAHADAYQMLAYSEIYQRQQTQRPMWLIYPHLPELPAHLPPITYIGGQHLHLKTINLKPDPDGTHRH